ncbi:BamA/TamA family outer membrane protein [Bdellovibrio bacteriovorus]|uniref:BamA/TamA family outer membrane protein n=1 Tax=Bdellovibrio bacteriovorus TaxID=959 RepID=UPI0035A64655
MVSAGWLSVLLIFTVASAKAQDTPSEKTPAIQWDEASDILDDDKALPVNAVQPTPFSAIHKKDKNEFVIAPIPFLNPSQGWGIALVGQYIFTLKEDESPPSIVGGGAFYTEKHSFGGGLAYSGKLANDQWRVGLATGKATVFYDFYGIGYDQNKEDISIPLKQEVDFVGVRLMKQVTNRLFLGFELVGAAITTGVETPNAPESLTDKLVAKTEFVAPNLKAERDTRNDTFYPTAGSLLDLQAEFHSEELHDKTTYQTYKVAWNQYLQFTPFSVLAYRLMSRFAYGEVPFYSLSMFGQGGDLRGYETGKYRDKMMWAAQSEYRHRFTDRWGGVAFAGAGQLAPTVSDFDGAAFLGSGGLGLRFRIAQKNPVDFRFDAAYGDQKISYYFSVGQAF